MSQIQLDRSLPGAAQAPLCVDLDGTLVKSDTLVDSLLVLLRTRPKLALGLPGRLFHGKAAFKAVNRLEVTCKKCHQTFRRN